MMLRELIERKSSKPLKELLQEGSHLRFNGEVYRDFYCEHNCPLMERENEGVKMECPGGCQEVDDSTRESLTKVYAGDELIGEILREGYGVLGVAGIEEPFVLDDSQQYASMDWEDAYQATRGICAGCEKYGTAECPEDILSEECPRSGKAWAIERIAEAVNEVIA